MVSQDVTLWKRIAETELENFTDASNEWGNQTFPSNSEVNLAVFLATHKNGEFCMCLCLIYLISDWLLFPEKFRFISEEEIRYKASIQGYWLGDHDIDTLDTPLEERMNPGWDEERQNALSSAASFIRHGYITEVNFGPNERFLNKDVYLEDVDLTRVSHASYLGDLKAHDVYITNVVGNIAPIISKIKCKSLYISCMTLSATDTQALVTGMMNNIECIDLGSWGGCVKLHWDTLRTFNDGGVCRSICFVEPPRRYIDQLATFGETLGWRVEKPSDTCIYIMRK